MSLPNVPLASLTVPAPLSWTTVAPTSGRGRITAVIASVVVPHATASVVPSLINPLRNVAAALAAAASVSSGLVVGTLERWASPKCRWMRCSTAERRPKGPRTSMCTQPIARAWAIKRETVDLDTAISWANFGVGTWCT